MHYSSIYIFTTTSCKLAHRIRGVHTRTRICIFIQIEDEDSVQIILLGNANTGIAKCIINVIRII